jgi:hypothetical protein
MGYCTKRRDLEERSWALTSRRATLTDRLMSLIGRGDPEFPETLADCQEAGREVANARVNLREHRKQHGC